MTAAEHARTTPKDFFLWIAAMLSLYVSIFSLIALFFQYIDHALPDPLQTYVDPYSSAIRFAIASLVVLFPVFLLLMRLIRKATIADPSRADIWVRRWALYLTLFIAGVTIVVDLITLINTYLGGDLTARFSLKVLIVFLVSGAGFLHFLADLRGYWNEYPERARMIGWGAGAVVLATIVAGFFIIGSPTAMREQRFDEQKVNDLTSIQWQIVNFWQQKQKLPGTLNELNDQISGYVPPVDPQTGGQYRYEKTGPLSFRLCAEFNAAGDMQGNRAVPAEPMGGKGSLEVSTWQHGKGEVCFDRTIDPELYPPAAKPIR